MGVAAVGLLACSKKPDATAVDEVQAVALRWPGVAIARTTSRGIAPLSPISVALSTTRAWVRDQAIEEPAHDPSARDLRWPAMNLALEKLPPTHDATLLVGGDVPYERVFSAVLALAWRGVDRTWFVGDCGHELCARKVRRWRGSEARVPQLGRLAGGDLTLLSDSGSPFAPVLPPIPSATATEAPPDAKMPEPDREGLAADSVEGIQLSLIVTPSGIVVAARGARLAPGCKGVGGGVTVPSTQNALDREGLAHCLALVRSEAPDFAADHRMTVTANGATKWTDVLATIDAAADAPARFDDVILAVAR